MLKPFFCYFGGKYRSAPRYPQPIHDIIIEPFAGAAGYSVRNNQKNIILYDKDPIIANLWNYLINVKESEINNLPLDIVHVDQLHCCQEAKYLIGFWLNKGAATPCKTPSGWMRDKLRPNSFWGEVIRNRISEQLKHIRHWKSYNKSYLDINNQQATWFIDPPYEKAGKDYKYSSKQIDFYNLGDWCKERQGQVIVCENEGAHWLPFKTHAVIKGTLQPSKEVIWYKE